MKIIETIKDFIEYRKALKSFNSIPLTEREEEIKSRITDEMIEKITSKSLEVIYREVLSWDISTEYIKWYRQWIIAMSKYFKS